ncbi:MAG: hypothetical protein HY362_04805 [Candidatus Aenigmarchaeota archaeon]|nr:hypothetical protein [Candidatus Aenigmarchaeota archaeon]
MVKLIVTALILVALAAGCTSQATGNAVADTTTTTTTAASPTTTTATIVNETATTAKTTTTTTIQPKPDLTVEIVSFEDGNRKPLMYVLNTGEVNVTGVRVRVDYSLPTNSSAKYACVYPGPTGYFETMPGKIYQASCNVSAKIPGNYEVIAFVDPDNRIAESNEGNNKFTTIIYVS